MEVLRNEKGFEPVALHNSETEFLEAREKLKQHQDFLKIQEKISQLPIKYQEVITLRFFREKANQRNLRNFR